MLMNIPTINPPGKALYVYWEDFLTKDDINYLLTMDAWNDKTSASVGLEDKNGIDDRIRISDVAWSQPDAENFTIWEKFSNLFARVNAEFFQYDLTGFHEPMQLTYYQANTNTEKSGHYIWHMDLITDQPTIMRKLSMVLMLSDTSEFEGGDLQLQIDSTGPITLEQKQGRAWFFPSWVIHQVTPVTQGSRKTAILWAGGPPFK